MDQKPVYFYSWNKNTYSIDKYRQYFCQWYKEFFFGKPAIYDTSTVTPNKYIHGPIFNCREQ